ncbi:hypothetical protein [Desulfovibrio oxyclinae]|uniref:hypothetical protein n=1 Tax=Desulfovibrio oxyclinae TaxID=63560 RepID=UPI000380059E|nr:hypothetical protein [Desulfovibrio oxyclinae]
MLWFGPKDEFLLFSTNNSIVEIVYFLTQSLVVIAIVIALLQLRSLNDQLKQNKDQMVEEHKQRRRAVSLDLLHKWNALNNNGINFVARRLVKELPVKDKKALIEGTPFSVPDDLKGLVKSVVCRDSGCGRECEECKYVFEGAAENKLTAHASIIMRQTVVTYLNLFENISSAYVNNVANKQMLKEQFAYIASGDENYEAMLNDFGIAHRLPCTSAFIDENRPPTQEGLPKTGTS